MNNHEITLYLEDAADNLEVAQSSMNQITENTDYDEEINNLSNRVFALWCDVKAKKERVERKSLEE